MEYKNFKEWLRHWHIWFWESSKLVGAPVLLCLILVCFQRLLFTGTCALAGYQCAHGFGSAEVITSKVTESITGTPSPDLNKGDVVMFDFEDKEAETDAERLAKVLKAKQKSK